MKKRLNNALNSLDERLVQEAAEADRLESNLPKIMRNILIPTGAAAAAGLCVFALANRPDGGVSLNESSANSAGSTVTLPVNASQSAGLSSAASQPAESSAADSLPESIPLTESSAELAKGFGEKATLLYADDDMVIFTDFLEAVYYKDLNSGEITYSADVGSAIIDGIGHETLNTFPIIVFTAAETDAGEIRAALVFATKDNEEITYTIDQTSNMLQRENGGFQIIDQEQAAVSGVFFGGRKMSSNVLKIGENKYIGMRTIPNPNGNADIREIVVFSLENDTVSIIDHQPVFSDEYLDQDETQDSSLSVYELGQVAFRFNTAEKTFVISTPPSINHVPNGSYDISGEELILTIGEEEYRCAISGDTFVVSVGENGSIPAEWVLEDDEIPDYVDELTFTLAYGSNLIDSLSDARSIIPDILKQYYEDKGITDFEYDEAILRNMSNPINAAGAEIVCYNGYDEWRGGNHDGIDITGENIDGADISAPLDGTVIAVSDDPVSTALGKYVVLDHGNGLATVYAHCGEITVTENQQVSQGEVIAKVGSTGFSTGAHLHFEIRKGYEVDDKAMALFTGKFMLDTIPATDEQQ